MFVQRFAICAFIGLSLTATAVFAAEPSRPISESATAPESPGIAAKAIITASIFPDLPEEVSVGDVVPLSAPEGAGASAWAIIPTPDRITIILATADPAAGVLIRSHVIRVIDPGYRPPVPPGDTLADYARSLADGLQIGDRGPVAELFSQAAPRIESGELRGSQAIVEAVSKPLAALNDPKWQAFSTMLFQHLLNDRRLVAAADWAAAYRNVASGLKGGSSRAAH